MNIPINIKAPVQSRDQITIEAPIDIVWQTLTDIVKWPEWQKNVTEAVVHGKVEEGTPFNWKAGGLSFKSSIHTMKPKSKFGWTGTTFGTNAIHNWIFEEKNGVTIVFVEESLQGLLPKLLRRYFQKNLDQGIKTNLNELKIASEIKVK
jgi:uncharacterized membrane protein